MTAPLSDCFAVDPQLASSNRLAHLRDRLMQAGSAQTCAQLAELLFEQIGLNKRESKDMIDAFFDLIADSLVEGKDVKISGFGNFQIRTKAPRPA